MHDANDPLDPVISLFIAHAPVAVRDGWRWLWTFEKRINDALAKITEPVLAQMRIAWWRDRIADVDRLAQQRDPMLQRLGMMATDHPVLPHYAAMLLDAHEAMVIDAGVQDRAQLAADIGETMAACLLDLMGQGTDNPAAGVGAIWGRSRLRSAALPVDAKIAALRLPRALSLMRMHAHRIALHDGMRRRDGVALVLHSLTGTPKI